MHPFLVPGSPLSYFTTGAKVVGCMLTGENLGMRLVYGYTNMGIQCSIQALGYPYLYRYMYMYMYTCIIYYT